MRNDIFVENVSALLYAADFNSLYSEGEISSKFIVELPVCSFNYTMAMGSIPNCNAYVMQGADAFTDAPCVNIYDVLAEINKQCVYCYLKADISKYNGRDGGISNSRRCILFEGIIVATGIQTSIQVNGSSNVFSFVISHPYSILKRWGSSGMIYSDQKTVSDNETLQSLKDVLRQQQEMQSEDDANYGGKTVIGIAHNVADSLYKEDKKYKNIETALSDVLDAMQDGELLESPIKTAKGVKLKLKNFLDAKLTPRTALQDPYVYNLMKRFLSNFANTLEVSDLCTSILTACASPEICITAVPRSLKKIHLIPQDGIFTDMPTVNIDSDAVLSISTAQWNTTTGSFPDGIIVLCGNSDNFDTGNNASSIIQSTYPVQTAIAGRLRWRTFPAPAWFNSMEKYTGSTAGAPADISHTVIQDLCSRYARVVYNRLAYAENRCNVTLTPDCLGIYQCLGQRCRIAMENSVPIYGVLTNVTISYHANPSGGINIAAGFNYCGCNEVPALESVEDNTDEGITEYTNTSTYTDTSKAATEKKQADADIGLYSIDIKNAPTQIPDILSLPDK